MTTTHATQESKMRSPFYRDLLLWTLSFLAIPLAGYLGTAIVGRVDNPISALVGGAFVGGAVGLVQALLSRRRLSPLRWTAATAVGMSVAVGISTLLVGYATDLGSLAIAGGIAGALLGLAQTFALPSGTRARWLWVPVTAVLWPLAWIVTTLAGIHVEQQFIMFGASGAIVYTVLAGLTLHTLLPRRQPTQPGGRRR
jgi:hypothetical protein